MNAPCVEGNRGNFCLWNPESWVLESGIQLKGSGIPLTIAIQNPSSNDKYWNPVPRIQNPQRGIQNPRLCWIIPLHGVKDEYLYSIYVYITWIFEPRALSSTNYFSKSILRNSVTAGEVILFFDASLAWDQALEWEKKKKIGERTELKGSLRKGKCGAALSPSPGHRSARFLRRYSYLTPFFAFFPLCGAWSRANDSYAMKLEKLPLKDKMTVSCLQHIISIVTNNKNELWKTVRSTSFPKPQLESVSIC